VSAQTAAERLEASMVDTCVFRRSSTTAPIYDDTTGNLTPAAPTTVYAGPCMVAELRTQPSVNLVGGEAENTTRYQVSIPHSATGVRVGDRGEITSSWDPALQDIELTVRQVIVGTRTARRRLICDLVVIAPRDAT
jgi:hypothetical protein